jgi:hypothetical protein
VGLLVDIVHALRVRDPHHAAWLYRALGATCVSTTGWEPRTHAHLDHVLDAATPEHESQITFRGGSLASSFDALDRLALAIEGYLDINTQVASLRVWPTQTWMHGYQRLPDDVVSAILGRWVRVPDGESTIDDVTFKLPSDNGVVPFDVETPRTAIAARLFRALASPNPQLTRGFCNVISGATREPLRELSKTIVDGQFEASVDLEVDAAAELARHVPYEELTWDASDVRVELPEGRIMTYILAPVPPQNEAAWRARISEALTRAAT